ncbi:hypothetical protein DSECCO2_439120 [anaerobic digester metagenome]
MNRLTKRNEDIIYYTKGKYSPKTLSADMEPWEVRECMQKLAAYEDTGLEPEDVLSSDELKEINIKLGELIDYINLEEQDLLIKLPCKVGGTLYITSHRVDGKGHVRRLTLTHNNLGNVLSRLGNDVFLTREEAEKALEAENARE